MKTFSRHSCTGRVLAAVGLLVILAMATPLARAVVVNNLYDVEFPVPDQSSAVRSAAFSKGLEQVLIRISGSRSVLQNVNPGKAASYVQQFSYMEATAEQESADVPLSAVAETSVVSYSLKVQYNAGRIINLLRENGQPVWGEHRSEAVVWLAVRDGADRYVLKDSDTSLLKKSVEDSMARRGLPLVWPIYDLKDQQQLGFTDVWAAFERPVTAASKRYTRGPAIVGRLSWTGNDWKADWALFVEKSAYSWSLSGSDYNTLIAEGIDLAADEIGKHYAVLERTGISRSDLLVEIHNIDTLKDYRNIQQFFAELTAVRQAHVVRVDRHNVVFHIDLRGDMDDFTRLVSTDRKLEPLVDAIQPGANPAQTVLRYNYRK
ncbi:MAG: DUF2066 domain-containing protein [Gammaproteobacteria bacterium]